MCKIWGWIKNCKISVKFVQKISSFSFRQGRAELPKSACGRLVSGCAADLSCDKNINCISVYIMGNAAGETGENWRGKGGDFPKKGSKKMGIWVSLNKKQRLKI